MENLSGQPRGGRNVAAPPKENFFFLDWPTRILYSRLDSCQDFEKAAGGRTAAVKMPRDSKPRAVRSELYRDNPVTHIELYVCVFLFSKISIPSLCLPRRGKAKKRNRLGARLIAGLTPLYPFDSKGNVSLLNARRHAFRFTSYFRPRL